MINIRKATLDDVDSIREMYRDIIFSINSKDYNIDQLTVWASFSENRNAWTKRILEQHFLVAVVEAELAGFSSISDDGYIDFMFTHKDHQGEGIASEMLLKLEDLVSGKQVNKIWAVVSITARPFFLKKGFRITERFTKEVKGVKFDDCIMTKYLNQKEGSSKENDIEVRLITHGSEEYKTELELRNKILRIPLGLDVHQDDLSNEHLHHHIGAFENDRLIGILVLTPLNSSEVKMRQVAVDESLQSRGIGKKLVEFSEQFAKDNGFKKIVMNARDVAVPFYEKLGYKKDGDMFVEVTIPHFKLYKHLHGD